MNKILIGLAGKAGCGKDAFASFLCEREVYAKYALAFPIKKGLMATFDLKPEHFEDRELKEKKIDWIGKSPRELAQLFGTEFGRDIVKPTIWLDCAGQRWNLIRYDPTYEGITGMIVTDVRFENEAQWIREHGGTVVHVKRADAPNVQAHSSEAGVEVADGDVTIYNDGTLDELKEEAFAFSNALTTHQG